ncbi:hypothetical protein [Lacibacter sediminis]|uniref:Uncharacterized protein n=1 Tax=Lacibacter sediminis TaxID=2760713 RepID=A0A7G5XM26_9BACT|nr:hypothetical protein [Lacibacter sediminis]QNA46529.1 hypothetical protein H4075_10265 [Lacibacter sediminis]
MKLNFTDRFLNISITIVSYLLYIVNLFNVYMTPGFPYRNAILVYAFWTFPVISLLFAARYFIKLTKGEPEAKPFVAIHVSALIIFFSFIVYLLPKME